MKSDPFEALVQRAVVDHLRPVLERAQRIEEAARRLLSADLELEARPAMRQSVVRRRQALTALRTAIDHSPLPPSDSE